MCFLVFRVCVLGFEGLGVEGPFVGFLGFRCFFAFLILAVASAYFRNPEALSVKP